MTHVTLNGCTLPLTAMLLLATLSSASLPGASVGAQDTLTLGMVYRAAETADPRAAQVALLARQSALRERTLRNEQLPTLNAVASGTYLSDVARVGGLPGGLVAGPLQQQYDASITARQVLYDPSRRARTGVEQAQLAEGTASVRSALWQLRAQANDAFFGVLLRTAQRRSLEAAIADLRERRRVASERVAAGAALPSEALLLEAEIARREQQVLEAQTEERALREVLGALTGVHVSDATVLSVPDERAALPNAGRERPEFAQFAAGRDALAQREAAIAAQSLPRVALVGRGGYGRPGLNALGREFDSYYTLGLQVEWTPWNWGATARDREVQRVQSEVVTANEAALAAAIDRAATVERARISALEATLTADSSIIALRERVLAETRLRSDEGEATAADYVMRLTEALNATLDRDLRRIRLAEARARYLTTIGHEVR